jgi:hypothetical protein
VPPTSCHRRHLRRHPRPRLLHRPALAPASWASGLGVSAFTTAGVRPQLRFPSRRRLHHRFPSDRSSRPLLRLPSRPRYGRPVPRQAPCHRPCSGTASPRSPRRLRCLPTLAPRSQMRIGVPRWLMSTRHLSTMAPSVSFLARLAPTSSPARGSSSTSSMLTAPWHAIRPGGSFEGSRSDTASTTTRRSVRSSNQPPSGLFSASPSLAPGRSISWT